ncbi:peptidase S8 [Halorhabdus sp. CBA1104]|uniref:S8 family serine peptidase n=1 Tax=Halorhabdus sp. CBA1104 TaxID=1380432 RepID=UPI0012B409ED|nr:S8 family serine peptidase [Halorhabdus sp. CBA1104]QGN07387.1 peptidase S8 [Halorhabdus sp. CBA1104]
MYRHRGFGYLIVIVSVIAVTLLLLVNPIGSAAGQQPVTTVEDADNATGSNVASERVSVIVEFKNTSAREQATIPGEVSVTGGQNITFMPVLFMQGPRSAFEALEDRASVIAVKRDSRVAVEPPQATDPSVSTSEQVSAANQVVPWGADRISAQDGREAVSETAIGDVDVAVLDTGIDYTHSDLETVRWGANFSNGVTRFGRSTALDNQGHGTAVAGVVAAADDEDDVVGVAPGVDLYAIKVMNRSGEGRLSWVINGIDAALKGADGELGTNDDAEVLSLSLGSATGASSLQDAINAASDHAVVVAAAGNGGDGDVSTDEVTYPARYDGAIAVAATDRSDETPAFSAEGAAVELAAPGVDVTTTWLGGGTITASGTSLATPHVAGTAAIVIAQDLEDGDRDRSPNDVRTGLQETAIDIEGDGIDKRSGYGLVNVTAALGIKPAEPATFSIESLSPGPVSIVHGESVTVSATITNTGGQAGTETVALRLNGSVIAERSVTLDTNESETITIGNVFADLSPNDYEYSLSTGSESVTALLTVQNPAQFVVRELSPGNVSISSGDTVTINGSVKNTGDVAGAQVVSVWFDDEVLTERNLSLSAGETQAIPITDTEVSDFDPGSYSYGVKTENDSRWATLRIRPHDIAVVTPIRVVPGRNATVSYTISNDDAEVAQNVSLAVEAQSAGVTVRPTNQSLPDGLPAGAVWTTNVTLAVDRDVHRGEVRVTGVATLDGESVRVNKTVPVSRTDVTLHAPDRLTTTPGSSVNISYTLANTGLTQPSAGAISLPSVTDPLSVNGSDAAFLGLGSPVPAPGESVEHTFRLDVPASTPSGTYAITGQGNLGSDVAEQTNTTIVVRDGIDRFDQYEPSGEIGLQDVLATINAYNNGDQIGDDEVSIRDVLDVISAYNDRSD